MPRPEVVNLIGASNLGYDSFHENAIFGDVSYSEIRQVLQALIGYTLKHKDHCAALLSKTNYTINPWNIYTLSSTVDNLADAISKHKSIATTKVKTIIDVLTINRDNIDKLLAIPGSAPAPLIKVGKDHVLRSICGTLSNPFDFLTASLKLNFASSYFKAVNDRENIFREELYSLLDSPRFVKTSRGITLRDRGKILTDIDAMVYDPDSKCLFIIQLKWLEDFGTSMKMRYSMQRNFYSSSIKWVENVLEWLRINGLRFLLAGQKEFASYINDEVTVQLLILGRNFSHFSDSQDDKRAIWYSWYRLLKGISSNPKIKENLFSLAAYMKSHSLQEEKSPKELSDELQVGKYKIQIKI